MSHILGALDIIFGGIFLSILYDLLAKHRRGPLPAGPRGWPLIGSVLEWPQSHEWLTFAKWGEKWGVFLPSISSAFPDTSVTGDIMSATLLGQTIVILNSAAIAEELLDKRSSLYSDRPTLMMAGELVGWSNSLALSRYGNRFREYRRFIFRVLGTRAQVQQYHALSVEENQRFLHRLLHDPDNVAAHIRK